MIIIFIEKVLEFLTLLFHGYMTFSYQNFMAIDFSYYPKYGSEDVKLISITIGPFCIQISSGVYE